MIEDRSIVLVQEREREVVAVGNIAGCIEDQGDDTEEIVMDAGEGRIAMDDGEGRIAMGDDHSSSGLASEQQARIRVAVQVALHAHHRHRD